MIDPAADGLQVIAEFLKKTASVHDGAQLYRGHADSAWTPTPSVYRPNSFGIRSRADLQRWRESARRFLLRRNDDIELLVLAQHYGVPTPLLDWTSNPLVALFFACQPAFAAGDYFGQNGAVLSIPKNALQTVESFQQFDPLQGWSGSPVVIDAMDMNKRTLAQDSVMTLHCEANQSPQPGWEPRFFEIEISKKQQVIAALSMLGVSSDRVYADINTVAREFAEAQTRAGSLASFAAGFTADKIAQPTISP